MWQLVTTMEEEYELACHEFKREICEEFELSAGGFLFGIWFLLTVSLDSGLLDFFRNSGHRIL